MATTGVGVETQIEQELAGMEYALRKEKAPSLYDDDHDVGFQVLEVDEDEQKAVGVRVFRVGADLWLYAPIFFIRGQLLGDELLMIKDKDLIVPFEGGWVKLLLAKEPFLLGRAAEGDGVAEGTLPDFSSLINLPRMGSGISAGTVKGAGFTQHCVKIASSGIPAVNLRKAFETADEGAKLGARMLMLQNIKLAEHLVERFPDLLELLRPVDDIWWKSAQVEPQDVRVITSIHDATTVEQKLAIVEQGVAIIDNRTSAPTTELAAISSESFYTPETTGFYKVELEDGPVTALVIARSRRGKTVGHGNTKGVHNLAVVNWDDKVVDDCPRTLAAYGDSGTISWREQWSKLPEDVKVKKGNDYLFIGPDDSEVFGPINDVREITNTPEGSILVKPRYDKAVLLTQASGDSPLVDETRIVLPKQWKPVHISSGSLELKGIDEILHARGIPVHVKRAEAGLIFEWGEDRDLVSGLPSAMTLFLEKYAMTEDDARRMYTEALRGRKLFILKEAQPPGMLPISPAMPPGLAAGPPMPGALPPELQATTQNALQRGQTDVLDASILSSMMATSDSAQYIRKFLGDLLTGVDRLGRILFVMYSHDDEFRESFGPQEFEDLRDEIVDSFKSLGKVFLDLREKLSSPADLPILE